MHTYKRYQNGNFNSTAPTAAPPFTSVSAVDPATVLLQWIAPDVEYQNGIIREYWISITNTFTGTMEITQTGTTAIIGSLVPSFTYQFSVAAYTVDVGPYNSPVAITMPESGMRINVLIIHERFYIEVTFCVTDFHSTQWISTVHHCQCHIPILHSHQLESST